MAGTNDFLPFATAGGANVLSQSAYAALAAVATGYQAGVAQSAQLNKTWRQSSIIAAMVAQFIVDQTGANAVDDGTIATLEANFIAALRYAGVAVGTDTGAANACVVNYTPAIPSLVDGMVLWFKAATANTGVTTLNVNGLGAKAVVGGAHAALQGGEIVANGKCMVVYNSNLNSFVLIECTGAALQVGAATQSQHAMQLGQATGRLLNAIVYGAAGTYTYTPAAAGTNFIVVEGVGGGGAGAGAPATGASTAAIGGGGSAGSYFKVLIRTGFSGATVTVGSGGASNIGATGGSGNASSFGAFATAPGGVGASVSGLVTPPLVAGGAPSPSIATASPGAGGISILVARGQQGQHGVFAANGNGLSGAGAPTFFGPGGNSSVNGSGSNGPSYGSGGSGGLNNFSSAANAGGAGQAGCVIVWEYA